MGSIWLWQTAHEGSFRCCSIRSRMETVFPRLVSFSTGTFGGGGGGAAPSRFSRTHFPRTGGEVRVGYDETVRIAPWVKRPPRLSPSSDTRWNVSPDTPAIP